MPERDDDLWTTAGSRCAICRRSVRRADDPTTDKIVGDILTFQPTKSDQPERILLCVFDAHSVRTHPDLLPPAQLERLKNQIETLTATRLATGADTVAARLLTHVAVFQGSPVPMFFLKIINDSPTLPIQIQEIWFDTQPLAPIDNPQRPLPARLDAGDTFETWKPVQAVPHRQDLLWCARARLKDGTVVASAPNLEVAPAGLVADGGTPLSDIDVEFAKIAPDDPSKWDVFISHASEDKADVGRPLYEELTRLGLSVWFDEATLRVGDSLRRSIDMGVGRSAFGVVIVSPAFIAKSWTQYELDGIVTRTVSGKQNLLPIWHQISHEEVAEHSPSLADKVALSTSNLTIEQIAAAIADRVRPGLAPRG